jgi:histidinol-phosphate aminotransferase
MTSTRTKSSERRYQPPVFAAPITLDLSKNELPWPQAEVDELLAAIDAAALSRYPSIAPLEKLLAERAGVEPERLVVTAGGDDGIERLIAASLKRERDVLLAHAPTFEMFPVYAARYGARFVTQPWLDGEFPAAELRESLGGNTALLLLVTPNNPTGAVIDTRIVVELAAAARERGAAVLVDLAYVEFADEDPTPTLLELPNVYMVRSFSKAMGLAGLRVGYVVAPSAEAADELRALGNPYAVSSLSAALAQRLIERKSDRIEARLEAAKDMRRRLAELVGDLGGAPLPSEANFVLARFDDDKAIWNSLVQRGIAVRRFPDSDALAGFLRITCPADDEQFGQLAHALAEATGRPLPGALERAAATSLMQANGGYDAIIERETKETAIRVGVTLRGEGRARIASGLGFFDHMLTALACHSRMDVELACRGDLHVDDHHTVEDCALALGQALDAALGDRRGIARYGSAYAPLDEALARVVVDFSGRPSCNAALGFEREMLGDVACENLTHFFQSLAMTARCAFHVDVLRGDNDHHKAEAAFKALALALRQALAPDGSGVASTKGTLT